MPLLSKPEVQVALPSSSDGLPVKVTELVAEYEWLRGELHVAANRLYVQQSRHVAEQADARARQVRSVRARPRSARRRSKRT